MKCPECDEKLVDYLYNDLSPELRRKIDEHFKTCENCAKQLSQLQFVRTSFQQLTKHELPPLVHQRILAHNTDKTLKGRGSWLTQWLFRPSTATAIVALLAIGVFYYTQQFTPSETVRIKEIVKAERTPFNSKEILLAKAKPSLTTSGDIYQTQPGVLLSQVAKTLLEEKEKSQAPFIPSKGALYTFELGNLYFSQDEFEKAIATYSIALTMSPKEAYTSIIRYQLALSYKKLNDCTSAVQVLDEIQERNPQYPEIDKVFIMAGDCYLDLQAYDKAETNYTNFINQFPDRKSLVADKLETARMFRRVNLSY
ncbi:MAG: tetratricopeptide repeat protein [Deltaproteobacteria bacterium]|nr:tetratricopeptide repeat protein [Deltaproteobacteria bacterium]MCK5186075.1 tetratricopeptide repeat protein [Deltaproteobacteria bacterium]